MSESDAILAKLAEEARKRREAGRGAILEDAEVWRPEAKTEVHRRGKTKAEPVDDEEDEDAGEGPGGAPLTDHVTMPRFVGKTIRWVAISMPEEAPVTCLGKMGRMFFYLTPKGELVSLQDSEHGQAHIEALWSPEIGQLHRAFPQFDQSNRFKGFQAQYARAAMVGACGLKPLFDAHKRVRGLGCWRDDAGQLVQHLGDMILIGKTEKKPGEIDGYVYPGRPALPRPKRGGKADCEAIYQRIQLWNFERGDVDARILLGQQAAGVLGAAIGWRPMAFLTGDAGTGKSTLQRCIRELLPDRIISTVDASEAALRALLGQDALIVSFDEIEADANNDRALAVMKLARTSASGDDAHRSGQDQVARSFTLRGSFLFSAIVPPSMRQQDMQRFAFLRLRTLKKGQTLPTIETAQLKEMGRGLVGRITEGWSRWERTLSLYFQALQARGHEHRGAMQFGTCLAAAHILLEDDEPTELDFERWCDPLHRDKLFEYENTAPAYVVIWRHLLSSSPDVWRSHGSPTVAEVIRRWFLAKGAGDGAGEARKLNGWLVNVGLRLVQEQGTARVYLAVAPKHQGLSAIFRGTDFQAAGGEGAWNIPLRGATKIEDGGVLRVENVPSFGRQKCPMFWLGGCWDIAGAKVPIFDQDEDADALAPSLEGRLEAYLASLGGANSTQDLQTLYDRAQQLRAELAPPQLDMADAAFNARWAEIEGG